MPSVTEISERELEEALETGQDVRALQIIHGAMAIGVVGFGAIVLFLATTTQPEGDATGEDLLPLLSMVHGVMALTSWGLGTGFFRLLLTPSRVDSTPRAGESDTTVLDDPMGRLFGNLRSAYIVRLACFEGPALFGLVICLLGVFDGTISEKPIFWLNGLSAAVLLLLVAATLPTRDRLMDLFRSRIAGAR